MKTLNFEQLKVAEVVAENLKAAHVFKKHGIDFCCGGGITLAKACEKNKVNADELKRELLNLDASDTSGLDFTSMASKDLVEHIVNTHHNYVRESIPVITAYAEKVAKVHGQHNPELLQIRDRFKKFGEELLDHLKGEEEQLFPKIEKGESLNTEEFIDEHEDASQNLLALRKLTNDFTPPEHACNTYRALFDKLEEFEDDLHVHIHLENNILFKKGKES